MSVQKESEDYRSSINAYWKDRLSGEISELNLPGRNINSKAKKGKGQIVQTALTVNQTKDLRTFLSKADSKLRPFLIASWNILFYRYTLQTDILIGAKISNPENFETDISSNENIMPLRNSIDSQLSFEKFHKKVEASDRLDCENQYSLKNIMKDIKLDSNEGQPLINTVLTFGDGQGSELEKKALQKTIENFNVEISNFDLEISSIISEDCLVFDLIFNPEIYEYEMIEKMIAHYKTLLGNIIRKPEVEVGKIDYLSKKESSLLIDSYSGNEKKYPAEKTVVDLFKERVEKDPNAIALAFLDRKLTYNQLDELTTRFANYLSDGLGVKQGDHVGIMLQRSEWLIVSILGTLKIGAAYVPIDLDYPKRRKDYIQKDSNCQALVDSALLNSFLENLNEYSLESSKHPKSKQTDLAYVIYTSGTTGNPKGVMIEHGSIMNLISSQTELFEIDSSERILQFSNYFFDASVEQIFLALTNGASLVIIDSEELRNHELLPFIEKHQITHLHATPTYLETLTEFKKSTSLKRIIAGGETCSLKLAKKLGQVCDFYNEYGPTETTVTSTVHKYDHRDDSRNFLPIGRPIDNTKTYILSDTQSLQGIGIIGELCFSGPGLARGYLNLEEMTAKKFVDDPFVPGNKMYLTGDLAKWLPDGNIAFIGRRDDQVKIRGHRIEIGEIEAAINQIETINQVKVIVSTHLLSEPHLVAYLQAKDNYKDIALVRNILSETLPKSMIPTFYIWVDEFPVTSNGKIDKKNLPLPKYTRPDSAPPFRRPRTKLEKGISKVWSSYLQTPEIGIDDNFFELGGNSLLTSRIVASIEGQLKLTIPVTKIYQYPTISQLSEYLSEANQNKTSKEFARPKQKKKSSDVAVIGMAGRFPGASSIDELWNVLRNGKETISFFSAEELDTTISVVLKNDPLYVAARGIVPSVKKFDARFFGLSPKLAQAMDPQQRLFLEISWEILEQTGHLPEHFNGSIGVYAGTGMNTYYRNNVLPNRDLLDQIGALQVDTLNEKDYVASRVAYHLNLKGPAVSVHSACSTSLLAMAEAVEAIRNGHCDAALAGGSSITSPIRSGHLYQEGSILSSDGHCRAFDESAKGTVFSDGAGVVLLKNLELAKKDGDTIYAVIKGIGMNNDGGGKGSFTAPTAEGQADAISRALHDSQIDPKTITYIEAHGTATPIGDPIEIEGLNLAFGEQEHKGYCGIGSIKSNMGHLTAAAGVAGFIKTILAMHFKMIPPSIGYHKPNSNIDFDNSPFYVVDKLCDWHVEGPRRAGVSSFGVGGTNVHIVLEEFEMSPKSTDEGRPVQLLPYSAKVKSSLDGYRIALGRYLEKNSSLSLADVSYSLKRTRVDFRRRQFVVAHDVEEAKQILLGQKNLDIQTTDLEIAPEQIAFLFPGQGAQYLQMGKALYKGESVFREAVDNCAELLMQELKEDIRQIIFPEEDTEEAENRLKDTRFTQPALFIIEYALSQLWMSWGIKPTLVCGHSIGEFVGAHLAGVFSLEDALRLITVRGRLVSELPGGSMLSVRVEPERLAQLLPPELSIAAVNSDSLSVVSGTDDDVTKFAGVLKEHDVPNKRLATSHAFHSTMMEPVLEAFKKEVAKVQFETPKLPIVSTVTGKWLKDDEAKSTEYWTNHLRATVRFSDAIETIVELENTVFVEVGPGRALSTLVRQKKAAKGFTVIPSLPIPKNQEGSYPSLLHGLGQLWLRGLEPDWAAFYKGQSKQKLNLPPYYFDKKPCWVDPVSTKPIETETKQLLPNTELTSGIENTNQTEIPQMRKPIILKKISELINDSSGIELEDSDMHLNFMEIGLDSLIMTQIALTCKREFNLPITFRQLSEDYNTPDLLAAYLDENLKPDSFMPASNPVRKAGQNQAFANGSETSSNLTNMSTADANPEISLIAQQLQLLSRQVESLQANGSAPIKNVGETISSIPGNEKVGASSNLLSVEEKKEHKKPFGASPRIEKRSTGLNEMQLAFLSDLVKRYNDKTQSSKKYSQENRSHMADPRVVTGFKPLTKELVYPLVINKSSGNRLWDLDGNEYIDALNGFGSCMFGHQPEFVKKALREQIELGYEVGPQHPLAGEVSQLLCEFTGHERAALCNTGSEAVLGAMRIARTVTGRSLIVAFTKSYHGINDEGIVRGSKKLKTFPAAAGILPEAVQNMLVLEYGTQESLRIIKERANELAAVLVEPVQSRRPEFLPLDFLMEVREITKKSETALIFDEVITGFRVHPGGFQAKYGIKADIATYGKVIGGGISIGAILGKKEYLDALDGGHWQYGDDSHPEIGVTYFAGTFVRHPLALAASKASLLFMKEEGEDLQNRLAMMTERMAFRLNLEFGKRKLPMEVTYFSSLWRLNFKEEISYSELLFVLLREKGIHIWDGFPCFLTTAYSEDDIEKLEKAIWESIDEMAAAGFFSFSTKSDSEIANRKRTSVKISKPPVSGARLGRDESGNPAWYVTDPEKKGEYVKIDL